MADQSTFGDEKMGNHSVAYINFDDVCTSVNVESFTLYKVERLCLFFGIDYGLISLFVLVQFLIPYLLWFSIFWGFRFPAMGQLENTSEFQEKTVSILVTVAFAFTLFFMIFLISFLLFDFLYVFSQLRLTFNNQFFQFISKVYSVITICCISVKFVIELVIVVFLTAFPSPVGIKVFWIILFSLDALLMMIPLCLMVFPTFKRDWLFKIGIRDVDAGFLMRESIVSRWQQSLENKIPKMYANIFVFLFLVNVFDHMVLLATTWVRGTLRIVKGMCGKKFKKQDDPGHLLSHHQHQFHHN